MACEVRNVDARKKRGEMVIRKLAPKGNCMVVGYGKREKEKERWAAMKRGK